jgi:predicted nucleotidyltransferase component of viral defense system
LPDLRRLADACRRAAAAEGVQPYLVEKDFYLTRLLWGFALAMGDLLLLKGGTCLSKVDLGSYRMSEDIDFVIPWHESTSYRSINVGQTNRVRDALRALALEAGVRLLNVTGTLTERGSHVVWTVDYPSAFATTGADPGIDVEVSLRPVLRSPRRVGLRQLLSGELAESYAGAYCWALDWDEVRAEKVRAALTRRPRAIRDFYDLGRLAELGGAMSSPAFVELVDRKLKEVGAAPLAEQPPSFGLTSAERRELSGPGLGDLIPVLRAGTGPFDLAAVLRHYDALWDKPAD